MNEPVSIHRKLLTSALLGILLLGGAILFTTFLGAQQAVTLLSRQIIQQTTSEMEARLEQFLGPARRGLLVARDWAESGLLPLEQPDLVNRALMPMMREFPQISSALLADGNGRETMLLHDETGWHNRRTYPDAWGPRAQWVEWRDGAVPTRTWRELDYDARRRPWYQGAVSAAGQLHWTSPYRFFTTGQPGITVSAQLRGGGVARVIAFDLLLRDISRFTMSLSAGPSGRVFVLTDDGRIIGLPALERFRDQAARREALLRSPEQLGVALVRDGARAITRSADPGAPVRFRSRGEFWWGAARPFALSAERNLRMLVVVPESDLLASLHRVRWWILGMTALVIALAAWRAHVIARELSRPIAALAGDSDRIAHGDLAPATPIATGIEEVGRLARAHEHMREALRTLLKLERDLAIARDIQQSTFPASVPRIEGFQLAAWSQPAEQTGGDTYDLIGVRAASVVADHPERVVLLLADATGHGIGPALSVTQVRAMLRMAVRAGTPLTGIVRHLNEQLHDDLSGGRSVTMWLAELHAGQDALIGFSAGQGPLLHLVAGSAQVRRLLPDAPPLGLLRGMAVQPGEPVQLAAGDVFAVISDGVFEARNAGDEMFGVERVAGLLMRSAGESAERICERLREELAAFTGDTPASDDRTVILIKRTPDAATSSGSAAPAAPGPGGLP